MNLGAVVPQETAVLPLPSAVLPRRTKGKGKEGTGWYYHGGRAVLPLRSGTAALLPQRGTAQSDTEKDPSNRRGRDLVSQR